MQTQATKSVHEANELPEEIEDFKDWLSDQEGGSYSEDDIADWGWDYVDDRVEYPNGVKTHYTTYTTKYRGSKYTCEVAWDNFNEVIQGSEVWQGGPESKKAAESVGKAPAEAFGKYDIVQALGNALHNEDEAYVIRFFEGTPGYAYAYNKNGHDAWSVSSDGTVEFEFDGESRGKEQISSLDDLKTAMLRLFGLQE